jgi:type I restriction enzyme S subunit
MKQKTAPQPTVEEQERDTDLPDGWVRTKLAEVVEKVPSINPESQPNRDFGYIDISSIDNRVFRIVEQKRFKGKDAPSRAKRPIKSGDVLFSNVRTYLRNIAMVPADLTADVCSTGFALLRSNGAVLSSYLFRSVLTDDFIARVSPEQTGTQYPATTDGRVFDAEIMLAPLPEQNRIVAKVDELFKQITAARDRLTKVPKILKAFRQSVLAAACSGRLTEDWRDLRQESDAHELLKAILRERKQDSKPSEPERSFIDDVPDGWVLTSIDAVTNRITSGSRDWKRYYKEDGSGTFVMAQNVKPLQFDTSYRLAVAPPQDNRDRKRSEILMGDILVTIVGANTGDVCRVPNAVKEHYVCQSVALMRPVMLGTSRFLELYLNSPAHGQAQYRDWIYGEGRPHLSFDHLRATAVMLPPVEEQHEIVRRVDALFKLADKIEERVAAATKRADKLTQSILSKAFRGELVPTEAELARKEGRTYEPASVLLERIKSEREKSTASPNGAKPRKVLATKK